MARPAKWKSVPRPQVEAFARLGWHPVEIGGYFGLSARTVRRRFAKELVRGRAQGRGQRRHMQYKCADEGSGSLLTWLARQFLGQLARDAQTIRAGPSAAYGPPFPAASPSDPPGFDFPSAELGYRCPAQPDPEAEAAASRRRLAHLLHAPASRAAMRVIAERLTSLDGPPPPGWGAPPAAPSDLAAPPLPKRSKLGEMSICLDHQPTSPHSNPRPRTQ